MDFLGVTTVALAAYGVMVKNVIFALWFVLYFGAFTDDKGVVPWCYLLGSCCFFTFSLCTDQFRFPFMSDFDLCDVAKPPLNFVGSTFYMTGAVHMFCQHLFAPAEPAGKAKAGKADKAKAKAS